MNQKTTYEQLITEKLEGMPVPDMADAIWARIERQLNIDMPTDDRSTDPDPDTHSGSSWVGGVGLFVFVAALLTIFLINKNHKKKAQSIPSPVQNIQKPDNEPIIQNMQGVVDSSQFLNKRNREEASSIPNKIMSSDSSQVIKKDTTSAFTLPETFEPFQPDTIQKVATVVSLPVQKDSLKPKRSRGVTGITDKDYRIVPVSKDSTQEK